MAVLVCSTWLVGCGGGHSQSQASPVVVISPPTPTPEPAVIQRPEPIENGVSISGLVTYDSVPHDADGGLDYAGTQIKPVRGASVYILDANDQLMAFVHTDAQGQYHAQVKPNTLVKVRVRAELYSEGTPGWVFRVTDNTQNHALYAMEGKLINSGASDSSRDLHASSGWGAMQYVSTRTAAPFAILDAAYMALQQILLADAAIRLEPVELRWSPHNIPVSGSRQDGAIGTTFYEPSSNSVYILGKENDDADEFDTSVILHELAHYIEDTLSRTDSLGGMHRLDDALDMRLAFSEGLANGFAGYVSEDGRYADASGPQQALGYTFTLEDNNIGNPGWFNENSIGKIIYDIADANNDNSDILALGFSPILQTLRSPTYKNSPALTSIYLFSDVFRQEQNLAAQTGLDLLLEAEFIFGTGIYGEGESNSSVYNISSALPVYVPLQQGETVNVCSNNRAGEFNGLDVRRFIRFSISASADYNFQMQTTLGTGDKDPDAIIRQRGRSVALLNSDTLHHESQTIHLEAGDYVLEVFDLFNVEDRIEGDGGSACFDVSLQ
ncbi:hypothetical protein TDB9533_03184 [Thalassocella blandensis]|nr:hypothetical protein TDB9533_03184 [Thalassocella blandensis]